MNKKTKGTIANIGLVAMIILLLPNCLLLAFTISNTLGATATNQFKIEDRESEMIRCEHTKECNATSLQEEIDSLYEERRVQEAIWFPRLGFSAIAMANNIILAVIFGRAEGKYGNKKKEEKEERGKTKMDNQGVTPVLGVILLMPTMLMGAYITMEAMDSYTEWGNAEAERASFYAQCAHDIINETREPHPMCPDSHNNQGDDDSIIDAYKR